jgi:hypothetical protein
MATVLPLLAAFLLDWSDPADLVRDLAHESIGVRERAAAELHRRGEDLRPFLMEAAEAAADPEIQARLNGVLRSLDAEARIRRFGGLHRVCGFAAQLRSDRWYGSGPFRFTLEIMNVGSRDQVFPGIGSWDAEMPDQDFRATGSEAKIVVRKFIGSGGFRRSSWRSPDGARTPVWLRPGECARYEYVLDGKTLPPGDYQVTVEYQAHDLIPDADERLRTNTVRLTVPR